MGGTYVDCEGTITYTYLYTDCAGNSVDWVLYLYHRYSTLRKIRLTADRLSPVPMRQ